MKIATRNVNSLKAHLPQVLDCFDAQQPDVVFTKFVHNWQDIIWDATAPARNINKWLDETNHIWEQPIKMSAAIRRRVDGIWTGLKIV